MRNGEGGKSALWLLELARGLGKVVLLLHVLSCKNKDAGVHSLLWRVGVTACEGLGKM